MKLSVIVLATFFFIVGILMVYGIAKKKLSKWYMILVVFLIICIIISFIKNDYTVYLTANGLGLIPLVEKLKSNSDSNKENNWRKTEYIIDAIPYNEYGKLTGKILSLVIYVLFCYNDLGCRYRYRK